ncbi:MAG TPA: hypothetical protein EYP19_01355 [Desulfobacterales bacterium]|nr:hypothetical protein [Desulfobacterales bacterium]
MKVWIGKSVLVIGILHSVFGFIVFRGVLAELGKELLFNTVDDQPDREVAFWFLFTGFALLILGGLIHWVEQRQLALPSFLKWSFLAITLLGCFIMPKSGFWLLLIPTVGMYLRCNEEGATKAS